VVKPATGCDNLKNQDAVRRNCLAGIWCRATAFLWRAVRGRLRPGRFPWFPVCHPRAVRHHNRV